MKPQIPWALIKKPVVVTNKKKERKEKHCIVERKESGTCTYIDVSKYKFKSRFSSHLSVIQMKKCKQGLFRLFKFPNFS